MQPNQGRAPGAPMPLPPGATQSLDKFLERWWVTVPGRLRQYSVYLSAAWADGIYLTAWPMVAALAPVVLLLFGLLGAVKRRDERRWILPTALVAAAIALLGGLGLAYHEAGHHASDS